MNTNTTKQRLTIVLFITVLALLSTSTASADEDQGWRFRLTAAAVQPTTGGGYDDSVGFGLSLGYQFSRRVGVEVEVLDADLGTSTELEFHITEPVFLDTHLDIKPVLARLNVHLTPTKRLDLYVGPVVGWLPSSDYVVEIRGTFIDGLPYRIPTDEAFVWGAQVGLDVPLGASSAFFTSRLTYLQAEIDMDFGVDDGGSAPLNLDPAILQVGLGYRF